MQRFARNLLLGTLIATGCGATAEPPAPEVKTPAVKTDDPPADLKPADPSPPPVTPPVAAPTCNERQAEISKQADERANPWGITQHLEKNFPDRKVSWLMKAAQYDTYVVKTAAKNFGRCDDTGCYLFAAPTAVITAAVEQAKNADGHDAAAIGKALGLPAKNFEGPLRMMTLDLAAAATCVRLPVDEDPGVWKCASAEDTDCFKFGGYTSGKVPELMVIDAPVEKVIVTEIP